MGALATLLGPTLVRGGAPRSFASLLLTNETDGLAADFTDMSMVVKDTATPANAFSGDPNSKLTYSSPSTKWILGSNGLYSSGTTLRTEYNTSGVALGCRIEEARTNLALRSQEFDNASWTKVNGSITADATVSPTGATDADLFSENSASGTHGVEAFLTATAAAQTLSFFIKYAGRQWVYITFYNTGSPGTDEVWYDIQNGVIGTTQANVTATMSSVGNGWYRITATVTTTAATVNYGIRGASADGNSSNYAGLNGPAFYLWGAQFETGAFATSPIVTAGSTVTRAADNISLATTAFNWSATAATMYAKFRPLNVAAERRALQMDDGTANEVHTIGSTSGAACFLQVTDGGAAQTAPLTSGAVTTAAFERLAVSIAANAFALTSDGAAQVTDVSGTLPTVTTLRVGAGVSGATSLNGHLAQGMVLPRTSTEAQLQGYGA